jgi:hypothetical protein
MKVSLSLINKRILKRYDMTNNIRRNLGYTNINNEMKKDNEILCLDFDGVICASSTESSVTAIIAAERYWPKDVIVNRINTNNNINEFNIIRDAIGELRPIIETGYENMLLARSLLNELKSKGSIDVKTILMNWNANYRDSLLKEYNANKMELIDAFGSCRDSMIENDMKSWINLNPLYPSIKNVLSNISPKSLDYDIVTTKNARFVKAILESNNVLPPISSRLYDLERLTSGEKPFGNKMNVLKSITTDYSNNNNNKLPKIHFVEDRYETLLSVASNNDLNHVDLYLADWGYNTIEQRRDAETNPRIKLLNPNSFESLLSKFIR